MPGPSGRLRLRVLVAEEHIPGISPLCFSVHADPYLVLVDCVVDAARAVADAVELTPDVVVLDSELPLGAIDAAREIRARLPDARLVIVNAPDDGDLLEALASGVSAHLPRRTAKGRLLRAIAEVGAGEIVLSRDQVAQLVDAIRAPAVLRRHVAPAPALTAREWQVLELQRKGLKVAAIADRLFLSPVTVRSHIQSVRRKLRRS